MATIGHEVKTLSKVEQYNNEAEQMLLRALDGAEGTWERHVPKVNLKELVFGTNNDNHQGE